MSTITTINASDLITNSRAVINTNFANLNSDKAEKSSNLSDMTVPNTALNNILPSQTGNSGKVLGTDGSNTSWVSPSGSPKATNIVQGNTALTVAAADPLLPNAVGDNDPRVPTQDENNALAGTGTPSSSNKYVTADTNALNELLSNKSTNTALGSSNTLYPTQNAVKVYADAITTNLGGWKYDGKVAFAADTTKTYTLTTTYDVVIIYIDFAIGASAASVVMTLNSVGSGYDYTYISNNAVASATGAASIQIASASSGDTAFTGTYYIQGKHHNGVKTVHGSGMGYATTIQNLFKAVLNSNSADVSTITITTSNVVTGTVKVFGITF